MSCVCYDDDDNKLNLTKLSQYQIEGCFPSNNKLNDTAFLK